MGLNPNENIHLSQYALVLQLIIKLKRRMAGVEPCLNGNEGKKRIRRLIRNWAMFIVHKCAASFVGGNGSALQHLLWGAEYDDPQQVEADADAFLGGVSVRCISNPRARAIWNFLPERRQNLV